MKDIIIVGSGPVGSFMAVLCTHVGFRVTVYEKRREFTRNINLKIKSDLFKKVEDVLSRLNLSTEFFASISAQLEQQDNKILIRDLENKFASEAKSQGATYIYSEMTSFKELHRQHDYSDCIILDCTGRNSSLRKDEFGPDSCNMATSPLQHAMYINCKAKYTENIYSIYQVIKYVNNIKLGQVIVNKTKDENDFTNITIPVFIKDKLNRVFDSEHPNINREPLNPFNSIIPVSDFIFFPISSLIGNLIVDGCIIDLDSIRVKKIEISCGYAKQRSRGNYICLGDSAIHLAFFRSLNLGLRHALELFVKFSMHQTVIARTNAEIYREIKDHERIVAQARRDAEIMNRFKRDNPHLNPIRIHPTFVRNIFLVVTKVIWYGCYSYNLTSRITERLTNVLGVHENEILTIHTKLNEDMAKKSSIDSGTTQYINMHAELHTIRENKGCTSTSLDSEIMKEFMLHNPHLNPVKIYPTIARNVFLVVTKVIWYGCFSYNFTTQETERLTYVSGVSERQISHILKKLNEKLSLWNNLLADFEKKRNADIMSEIDSNETKNLLYDFTSWFIDLNGKSFIKISELGRVASGKHALFKNDFEFILKCFQVRKRALASGESAAAALNDLMKSFIISKDKINSSVILSLIENELSQTQK